MELIGRRKVEFPGPGASHGLVQSGLDVNSSARNSGPVLPWSVAIHGQRCAAIGGHGPVSRVLGRLEPQRCDVAELERLAIRGLL